MALKPTQYIINRSFIFASQTTRRMAHNRYLCEKPRKSPRKTFFSTRTFNVKEISMLGTNVHCLVRYDVEGWKKKLSPMSFEPFSRSLNHTFVTVKERSSAPRTKSIVSISSDFDISSSKNKLGKLNQLHLFPWSVSDSV